MMAIGQKGRKEVEDMDKAIARIGRRILIMAMGVAETSRTVYRYETLDESRCPVTCPFASIPWEEKESHCRAHCTVLPITYHTDKPENERRRYHIKKEIQWDEKRLSRLQILQLLLLHFYPVDSFGFIKHVLVKEMAEKLNCHQKTIRANFVILESLGFLSYSEPTPHEFQVWLREYRYYHLSSQEGGTGYGKLPQNLFQNWIQLKSVNELRFAIRLYLKSEDRPVTQKLNNEVVLHHDKIKEWMPTHIQHPKAMQKLLLAMSPFANCTMKEKTLRYSFLPEYTASLQKLTQEEELERLITDRYPNLGHLFGHLIPLGMEYGWSLLSIAIENAFQEQLSTPIKNWGAYLRTVIRQHIAKIS
jgi:hypothetical protein